MEKSNGKETINRTSQRMLQGWRLMAICCPICHAALLAKDENMYCAGCDLPVLSEAQMSSNMKLKSDVAPPPPASSTSSAAAVLEKVEEEVEEADEPIIPSSYEELRKEYELKNAKRNVISSKLGAKLLEGWIMLSDSCPGSDCAGTPLMRNPVNQQVSCVACGVAYNINGTNIIPINDTKKTDIKEAKPTVAVASAQKPSQFESEEDNVLDLEDEKFLKEYEIPMLNRFSHSKNDSSWRMSQKLLQGWAMLDKSCVACNVPLMRDTSGNNHCVECESNAKENVITEVTSKATGGVLTSGFKVKDDVSDDDESADLEKINSVFDKYIQSSTNKRSSPDSTANRTYNQGALVSTKLDVSQILLKKLKTTATLLDETSSVTLSIEYAELITKLAQAVNAVESMQT